MQIKPPTTDTDSLIWYVGVIVLFQFQRMERRSRRAHDSANRQLLQRFQKWGVKPRCQGWLSAPWAIYWIAHHLTANELIRIVALVVAVSPDRKAICRLALPVRPGAKPAC